ncbi:chemotaxis protein CheW [Pseudogulbenkiania sp. MAI-1]|uniref:chemotaxis protein CheW n=1 Tax=Pseudogulbenkiania sp. MAI-1 TaxID=990370 RepID=UPI00045E84EC|nr:chemotaxis protein CheW [Pseudogulbenkiania sp. MAI-1]
MNDGDTTSPVAGGIEWSSVYAQLQSLESQLASSIEGDAAACEHRLRQRTASWAAREQAADPDPPFEVLAFSLGEESYGIAPHYVVEVAPLRQFTPLPGTPPFVLGIVNLRGRIVSVLDLRVLFEIPKRGLSERNHLVLLQHGGMEFGVLADRILGMQWVSPHTLQPALANLAGIRQAYLQGVTPEQWVILDGARLLGDEQLLVEYNS